MTQADSNRLEAFENEMWVWGEMQMINWKEKSPLQKS